MINLSNINCNQESFKTLNIILDRIDKKFDVTNNKAKKLKKPADAMKAICSCDATTGR